MISARLPNGNKPKFDASVRRALIDQDIERRISQIRLPAEDRLRLDVLVGKAFINHDFERRLVRERTEEALAGLGLTRQMCRWLESLKVTTLQELAQAILLCYS